MKRLLLTLLAVVVGLVVHATDYKLVTDVSQLEVGARYLVVGTNTKGTYAMGNLKKDNHYAIPVEITDNMRVAQMMVSRFERVELCPVQELEKTERGDGGFGHTGVG